MMGDNRDNSTDSRVLSQVGYVPIDNIVGRAEIIFFSMPTPAARSRRRASTSLSQTGLAIRIPRLPPLSRRCR